MSASRYSKQNIQSALYGGVMMPLPNSWFLGLHSEDPTVDGTVGELTGFGYRRALFTPNQPLYPDYIVTNEGSILFTATGGDWIQASFFSVWDGSGNMLDYQAMPIPFAVLDGNSLIVEPNELVIEQI